MFTIQGKYIKREYFTNVQNYADTTTANYSLSSEIPFVVFKKK